METQLDRILLIDDDQTNNFIHEKVLEKSNITKEILAVESAKDAFDLFKTYIPQLIILDLNMPALTGWDFLDQFEDYLGNNPKPSIIILSASADPKDIQRAKSNKHVSAFLSKPLEISKLMDALSSIN